MTLSYCQKVAVWQVPVILGYSAAIADVLQMSKVFSVKQAWLSLQAHALSAHLHAAEVIQELGHHKAGLGLNNSNVVLQVHGSLQGALFGPPAAQVMYVAVRETGWAGTARRC